MDVDAISDSINAVRDPSIHPTGAEDRTSASEIPSDKGSAHTTGQSFELLGFSSIAWSDIHCRYCNARHHVEPVSRGFTKSYEALDPQSKYVQDDLEDDH